VPVLAEAGPAPVTCRAPLGSMYLDQRGYALACAANHHWPLGSVAEQSLTDIWASPAAERLRAAMRDFDLGLGCEICRWQDGESGSEASYARVFDGLPVGEAAAPYPVQIEFALGNACNLQCVMCNGEQSSAIRAHREGLPAQPDPYDDVFFDELPTFLAQLRSAKFLGGEPFLVRHHFRVWNLMIEAGLDVPCHVTTNGTQWNDRIERVLDGLPVSIAMSMDGIRAATVAAIRLGTDVRTLLTTLDRFQAYTQERGTGLTLTFALMRQNWEEFDEFLRFADDRDLDAYVNVVAHPARYSLYRMTEPELSEVVAELTLRDATTARSLRRNRGVWAEQLDRLRHRLAVLRGAQPDGIVTSVAGLAASGLGADTDPTESDLVHELRAWSACGPLTALQLDVDDQVVRGGDAPGFLVATIDPVGLGVDDLSLLLESMYGRGVHDPPLARPDGASEHRTRHRDGSREVEVRVLVALRRGVGGAVLGTTRVTAARPWTDDRGH